MNEWKNTIDVLLFVKELLRTFVARRDPYRAQNQQNCSTEKIYRKCTTIVALKTPRQQ